MSGSPEIDARPMDSPPARGETGPAGGARIAQAGEARSARIESLRALAALSVVASHAFVYSYYIAPSVINQFSHRVALEAGYGGVDLFFVLSGYLLFWPFARSTFATGEKMDLRRYALNRVVRIVPLYYVVLIVLFVLQHHGGTPGQWWRFGLFVENFFTATRFSIDTPMWTLAVEVQFYVLLPFLALFIARVSRGSRARAALILMVLGGASIAVRQILVWHTAVVDPNWETSLPSVFFFFAAGMALALLRVGWQEAPPRWLRGPAGSSNLWILCSVPLWGLVSWRLTYDPAAALAAVLLVGACVLPLRRGVLVGLIESKPLSRLGLASYSIYLWHVPILLVIAGAGLTSSTVPGPVPTTQHFLKLLVLGAILCSLFALISYAVIEAPALRLRRRWATSLPPAAGSGEPAPAPSPPRAEAPSAIIRGRAP